MKKVFGIIIFCTIQVGSQAQQAEYVTRLDLPYYQESVRQSDNYISKRCVLDVYYPAKLKDFPTVVYFHGGGLKEGEKDVPVQLMNQGICVVAPNYRLYPQVGAPEYIADAASAVAWVFNNIAGLGGDPDLIFISGHSAGGYLASMIGLDKQWLAAHNIDANQIGGLIPLSGHTITHMTVRQEKGIPETQPIVDELAPLYHVRPDAPPLLLITGDRELELLGRYEENAYMNRMMKLAGHTETNLFELDGYGHNMTGPAFPLLLNEVRRIVELRKGPRTGSE